MRKTFITQIAAIALASVLLSSCVKDDYNLDDISDEVMFNTAIAAPIAKVDAKLADFFDLDSMKGKFKVNPSQVDAIKSHWGGRTPAFLRENGTIIDLSIMTKEDFEILKTLNIAIDERYLPSSSDYVEIDKLDEFFGEGNAIQELEDFTLYLDIANETPFTFTIDLQFAYGNQFFYVPLPGCAPKEGAIKIEANTGTKDKTQRYTVSFDNGLTEKLRYATGLAVKYNLNADEKGFFDIQAESSFFMHIKTYIKGTVNLSEID
ncbi:MAG: hypothetical protein II075_09520 [Bacteroidales bacterium]|nr:hypothetical protein [Bacteroidales bacterium]